MSLHRQSIYRRTLLAAALLSVSGLASAQIQAPACFDDLPPALRAAVEQDHWTILQPQDLASIDIPVWKNKHPGYCPGVASGKFRHNDTSYVIALIQKNDQNLFEKVIHVTPKKKGPKIDVVVPPTQLPNPAVVWSLRPHRYLGVDGTNVAISHNSFVYEKLVSTARQFYYDGSHLKSFIISY